MPSLLLTFLVGFLGVVAIAFGFLYNQDADKYKGMKWYQVLGQDLPVRIVFWVVGVLFLAWGGFFQFSHIAK